LPLSKLIWAKFRSWLCWTLLDDESIIIEQLINCFNRWSTPIEIYNHGRHERRPMF